ncbi:MAG: hypothetical protein JXP73_14145 [Deltaproteobacteria bacterium]|nr:hypothetical protein [Deltaproteobacteria bacterium]
MARGFLILATVCASCGTRSGLPKRALDAAVEVAPADAISAGNAADRDHRPAEDAAPSGPDLSVPADSPLDSDIQPGCTPLPVAMLPEPSYAACPPTETPPECQGGDVGAVVARSAACVYAWGAIPFQCAMWTVPAADEEMVVLELDKCTNTIGTVAASSCGDHIEVSYIELASCQTCDGRRSIWRAFTLPLDARPVIATGRLAVSPCPDASTSSGGATGAGGASRTGGATGSGGVISTGGVSGTGGVIGTGGAMATGGAMGMGGTGTGTGCAPTPIGEIQAAAEFLAYTFTTDPGFNPDASFEAEEITVPGLWEEMRAQLFTGEVSVDGSTSLLCSFIYRECEITPVTGECGWFGTISSGLVADGAFYYSWDSGSGIFRSALGKLAPSAATLLRTRSIDYFNPGSGPPGLVVDREGEQLLVYRAWVDWGKVNEWQNPEFMGTLADFGDRLAIVDDAGQELPSTLP